MMPAECNLKWILNPSREICLQNQSILVTFKQKAYDGFTVYIYDYVQQ